MKKNKLVNVLRSGMTLNIVGAIVLLLIVFGFIAGMVGFFSFTNAFKKEYSTSTAHMADTAATLVPGDHLDDYLDGKYMDEYALRKQYLDGYCDKMNVSLVYVILVDTSDYGHFVSVFNSVNNAVGNTNYTEWELGHPRETTNDEYRAKYKKIYEDGSKFETIYRTKVTDGQRPHITTMVPVNGSDGKVAAILCIQRPISELYEARRPYMITVAVSTVLLAAAASVFYAVYIRNEFVIPVRKVSDEATRFAKENVKGEGLGRVSRFREIGNLANSIDKMETDMVTYIDNLTTATAEKERISMELSLASTIQENSIPNIFPPFPERAEFDIYASMDPAREVGGDFYNFFLIDDDHLAMMIGDVSGKGIPAALFMMVTNILITDRAHMGGTPAEIIEFVNHNICEHNTADMFVTLWLGIIDVRTGTMTAVNAGHEYPVLKSPDGRYELFRDRHGIAVGAMDGVKYKDYTLQLEPGSKLFVYTDGVPEATDPENGMFGFERMTETLISDPDADPEGVLKNVRDAVDGFVKGAEQFDDLTMLCFEYRGQEDKTDE
ncbi:MAG: serine/threonine-protein phosphatase [Clostridia bacterium]|nr:serine/threonine-protein phosphatase [Clostridia bacterium]